MSILIDVVCAITSVGESVSEKVAVYIPRDLYEKARKVAEEGGFGSVDELVEFVLKEVVEGGAEVSGLSKEDEEKVKERLKALGYI